MLKLEKINKYFYRHKKNEIHVINNTSISFDNTGLVALLGPSGCGKTTLLNAIGGLDKINSGHIYINDQKMSSIFNSKKDKMRVLNIGYIFQNYNLLDNLTVYENVALSLRMVGIKNRFEIKKRVNYCLERTGMYRYRNKLASSLSGGQRQRVGIARAIVKNPNVIIADEPTGNLDSKNTIEIMNIIKTISKEKLVILVTHEKNLAEFYASRIITLEDGKIINDIQNEHENELDYRIDNKIYLKDFKIKETINNSEHDIKIYSDKKEKIQLDIVLKSNNIYIKTKNNNIEIVDENSGIELVDDNYHKISKADYENNNFDLTELDNTKQDLRYTSIYNFYSMLSNGLKKVFNYTIMKKILLIGFFVSAMFIVYAVSNIFGVTNIKDSNFIKVHREYIKIENTKNDIKDYTNIESRFDINYVIPGDSNISLVILNKRIYQLNDTEITLNASLADYNILKNENISHGRLPTSDNEAILDELAIDFAKKSSDEFTMTNLNNYQDFLNKKVKIGSIELTIVGISNTNNPSLYTNKDLFINIIGQNSNNNDYEMNSTNYSDHLCSYELAKQDIKIKRGRTPKNDYEVIVNIKNQFMMPLNKTINTKVLDKKLKVVGYFSSNEENDNFYVNSNTYKYHVIEKNPGMMIYSNDKEKTIAALQQDGYFAQDSYQIAKKNYINEVKNSITESLIIAGILLAISFIEIFLMIRASFLSRIKEVGIYRAIGTKKTDIYKMFLGEILIITTIASVPGAILMILILNEITKVQFFSGFYLMNFKVMVLSIILIYCFNIIIGLLPVRNTIKHTPAEILSRNDID